jgi:hypothetical protein
MLLRAESPAATEPSELTRRRSSSISLANIACTAQARGGRRSVAPHRLEVPLPLGRGGPGRCCPSRGRRRPHRSKPRKTLPANGRHRRRADARRSRVKARANKPRDVRAGIEDGDVPTMIVTDGAGPHRWRTGAPPGHASRGHGRGHGHDVAPPHRNQKHPRSPTAVRDAAPVRPAWATGHTKRYQARDGCSAPTARPR